MRFLLAATAAALVVGATVASSVLLLAGYRYLPERRFEVVVYLEPEITVEQRAAVESSFPAGLSSGGTVRFETREEALARLRERWKDQRDRVEGIQLESMSESFRLTSIAREFDCAPIPAIRELPGVERVWVVMRPAQSKYGAELSC